MAPATFDAAVEAARAALFAMGQGDPGPTIALWSRSEDVVLANPLGPPITGFEAVSVEAARVAAMFAGGEAPTFDEHARWSGDDAGYVVAIEHGRVRRHGQADPEPLDLRVTVVFRREADGWYLCVRHADRVVARPG